VAGLGWQELLIIFGILILLFGATRLPSLARSLGSSVRGFKKGLNEDEEDEVEKKAEEPSEKDDTATKST
jgi:sec-independent protein translocase protein TatA